jgi:UDPglucose--hexose-1-phosphate uridylyltransferase
VSGRWVIISSDRAKRPQPGPLGGCSQQSEACPFCAGNEQETPPEVLAYREQTGGPDGPGWSVRVVPNKYPAVITVSGTAHPEKLYESRPGVGAHEVVIESPEHAVSMALLEDRQVAAVLHAYRDRILDLGKDERWRHVLVYKNEGREAGATLDHVHSQLIALPEIPETVVNEIASARRHYESSGRCLFCKILEHETTEGKRTVDASERFSALCPYAPRFPYETWIVPKTHSAFFERCTEQEYSELAAFLRRILTRLIVLFGKLSFNYVIHSAPHRDGAQGYYHWHIEIMPKLAQAAGFEWGSGSFINPVAPEEAARVLRSAL